MKDYQKGELAKNILEIAFRASFILASLAMPGLPQIFKIFKANSAQERYRLRRAIKSLADKELIRILERNDQEIVEITRKGKSMLLKYEFDDLELKTPARWDKLWRLVIFDIAEGRRQTRHLLSMKLQELGFYQYQKSIYLYPYNCEKEIDFIRGYLRIGREVRYLVVKELPLDDEIKLKRYYHL